MAESSRKRNLRPVRMLATAVVVGLALTILALAWPALAQGSAPDITQVVVSSSNDTFIYGSLTNSGGTVYFNSLSGEGADQIITVTVTVDDNDASSFESTTAFGVTPTTTISGPGNTWTLTYTVEANVTSQDGVLFTVTDSTGLTDTLVVTFTQDNTDPSITSHAIVEDSRYLYASGDSLYYGNEMDSAQPFTVTGAASDAGAGLKRAVFSAAWGHTPSDDTDPADWAGVYTVGSSDTGDGTIVVTLTDRVGNAITQTFVYTRDTTAPSVPSSFAHVPDADSGGDDFAPYTAWEDDLTIDLSWAPSTDTGSGLRAYHLGTSSHPTAPDVAEYSPFTATTDGAYTIYLDAEDNVGNISADRAIGTIYVDRGVPSGGWLDLAEVSGGQYLYIADPTHIATGTVYYNNEVTSSFVVTGDVSIWGRLGVVATGKAVFGSGWGNDEYEDTADPYTRTYTIHPGETNNAFTVYFVNKAGSVQAITLDSVLDPTPPVVALTNVTDPQWDPDGIELDNIGNWYRTSALNAGWAFTSDVTDTLSGPAESLAVWDHSVVTNSQTIVSGLNGGGVFPNVSDDSDGAVTVTVIITDHVNNGGSDSLVIHLDGTTPTINSGGWGESSPYLAIVGGVLYYNPAMPVIQTATLSGTASDNAGGSDLYYAAFEQKANLTSIPVTHTITSGNWSSDYRFTSATGVGPGSVQATAYDHVGNLVTHTYQYVGTSEQPGVAFDNVTQPGYDAPLNNPLDDVGNWYTGNNLNAPPGNGWWFHAVITPANSIGIVAARATWEHQGGPAYYKVIYPTPGPTSVEGTFSNVAGQPSGLVTVTLTITDDLSRVVTDTLLLRIDKSGPTITGDGWTENSNYLYANGSTLYFSYLMGATQQTATLSGHADDGPNGVGANLVTFSFPESLGPSDPNPSLPNWSIRYFVSNTSTGNDSPVQVIVQDNLVNQTTRTYAYVRDITSPTTPTNFAITTPPVTGRYYNTRSLNLSWNASTESGSGLLGYYLGTSNPPSGFYPPATTATPYNPGSDGAFTFYLMAKDNVGNTSLASTQPITIDTIAPMPWIRTTPEGSQNRILVEWGADDPAPGTWPVAYTVEYRIAVTGAWQTWLPNTSSTSAYFGPDTPVHVELETNYYFRVRARDYVNNQSDWSAPVNGGIGLKQVFLPIIVRSFDASIPYFISGDFESGTLAGWQSGGALAQSVSSADKHGGTYAALLGSPSYNGCTTQGVPVGQAWVRSYVVVPSTATQLTFWYRIRSYDTKRTSGGVWWDRFEATIDGSTTPDFPPAGNPNTIGLSCSNLYDSGWQQGTISLVPYRNRTILLIFFNENHGDGWLNTYTYLDDIEVH